MPPAAPSRHLPQRKVKRSAAKMPGAKGGFPVRLKEQLGDFFTIGVILGAVVLLGGSRWEASMGMAKCIPVPVTARITTARSHRVQRMRSAVACWA